MAAHRDESDHIVISDEEARSGVTGHNVRYVLAFGLTGVIAVFAGIALYEGYDQLHARVSQALSRSPMEMLQAFAPYAAIALVTAIGIGLLLGVWSLLAGRSENASQSFMRFRVVAQFALICMIMAIFYVSRPA